MATTDPWDAVTTSADPSVAAAPAPAPPPGPAPVPATAAAAAHDPWAAVTAPTAAEATAAKIAAAKAHPDALTRANEVPRGFNSGVAGLLGAPMDTAINAGNLGKAAIEGGYLLSGNTPPTSLDPDRPGTSNANIPLSSDWIRAAMKKYFDSDTANQNPHDMTSRILHSAGEAVPAVATTGASSIPQLAGRMAASATTGAGGQLGSEGAHALKMGPLGEAGANVLGQLVTGGTLGRVAQPLQSHLESPQRPVRDANVQLYENNDIPVDLYQRTGDAGLRRLRNMVSDNPLTAAGQQEMREQQNAGLNRVMTRTMGENDTAATANVMNSAADRIGDGMDAIAARTRVPYDTTLERQLSQIENDVLSNVPTTHQNMIRSKLYGVLNDAANNAVHTPAGSVSYLSGPIFQRTTSELRQLSRDPQVGTVASDMNDALMDALRRGAQPEDVAALGEFRRQWRNMSQIEPAISKEGLGNISPAAVASAQRQKRNINQSIYGQGDQSLVRAREAGVMMNADTPNSGTPSRMAALLHPLTVLGGGAGEIAGHFAGLHPGEGGLMGAGVATALPLLAQRYLNSQGLGRYMANGITSPALRDALGAPSRAPYRAALTLTDLSNKYPDGSP